MQPSTTQIDRGCGVLLASGVGDALGAGYEFDRAPYDGWPAMIGGGLGNFAPGEWTDDTAQAIAIATVAATGADLRTTEALDAIAAGFAMWFADDPSDVGMQTRHVLGLAGRHATAAEMAAAAQTVHTRSGGRSAGNGSLMRTAPVALAHLYDPNALVEAAKAISALTHYDPIAGEGSALWCLMIRHAILHGTFPTSDDVLPLLGDTVLDWGEVLAKAESTPPEVFTENGWVVGALQAAWSAIQHTPVPDEMPCLHLQHALATAIGIGHDTDTVAAIAGALLGARWGASAVPQEWQGLLHGWGRQYGLAHRRSCRLLRVGFTRHLCPAPACRRSLDWRRRSPRRPPRRDRRRGQPLSDWHPADPCRGDQPRRTPPRHQPRRQPQSRLRDR